MKIYFTQFMGGCFIVWFLHFGIFDTPVCAFNIYMGQKVVYILHEQHETKREKRTHHIRSKM